jgi:cell division protein FtsL
MWGNTEYGGGPGPIILPRAIERPRFYKINLCVVTANVIIIFAVGMLWWKLLGYYNRRLLAGQDSEQAVRQKMNCESAFQNGGKRYIQA